MLRSVEGASRSTGFSGPPNAGSNSSTTSPARLSVLDVTHSRSEEHTSELQSLMRISYAVFCLKKKKKNTHYTPFSRTSNTKKNYESQPQDHTNPSIRLFTSRY